MGPSLDLDRFKIESDAQVKFATCQSERYSKEDHSTRSATHSLLYKRFFFSHLSRHSLSFRRNYLITGFFQISKLLSNILAPSFLPTSHRPQLSWERGRESKRPLLLQQNSIRLRQRLSLQQQKLGHQPPDLAHQSQSRPCQASPHQPARFCLPKCALNWPKLSILIVWIRFMNALIWPNAMFLKHQR